MKKVVHYLIAVVLMLVLPTFIFVNYNLLRSKLDLSASFAPEFLPKNEYLVDKSFVFILYASDPTPGSFEQNLNSIFNQKYDHFRVLLLLSENIQSSVDTIQKAAAKCNKEHLISLISVTETLPTLDSFRRAIELCKDDEIIIHMDMSGWLASDTVLSTLNKVYATSEDVWLTHAPSIEYPSFKTGQKRPWHFSPFKTYYAGLFKQLKAAPPSSPLNEETLNHYLKPLTKNSKRHIHFIESSLYIRKH